MYLVHLRITGKQAEGAALCDLQHAPDALRRARHELRRSRIRQVWRQVKYRLRRVVEVRRHHQLARVLHAQALADVIEAAAHRQGCRGEHRALQLREQALTQNLRDVNRRGLKKNIARAAGLGHALGAIAAPFYPKDRVLVVRFQNE